MGINKTQWSKSRRKGFATTLQELGEISEVGKASYDLVSVFKACDGTGVNRDEERIRKKNEIKSRD